MDGRVNMKHLTLTRLVYRKLLGGPRESDRVPLGFEPLKAARRDLIVARISSIIYMREHYISTPMYFGDIVSLSQ